jgi:hypothetical protein
MDFPTLSRVKQSVSPRPPVIAVHVHFQDAAIHQSFEEPLSKMALFTHCELSLCGIDWKGGNEYDDVCYG